MASLPEEGRDDEDDDDDDDDDEACGGEGRDVDKGEAEEDEDAARDACRSALISLQEPSTKSANRD